MKKAEEYVIITKQGRSVSFYLPVLHLCATLWVMADITDLIGLHILRNKT